MTIYTLFFNIAVIALILTMTLGYAHAKWKIYAKTPLLLWFIQYFMGALLIFSGWVKAVDPLGTAYKMADYFTILLPSLSFMKPYALPFALLMIVVEIVVGINLILGHGKKWNTGINLLMMLFFTFLTGYNYLTGYLPENVGIFDFSKWQAFKETSIKVSDCGCFGDFMKLLPVETFFKDILLTFMAIYLFARTSDLKFIIPDHFKWKGIQIRNLMTELFALLVTVFCFMNFYFDLPMIDFRPFKIGTNLALARAECAANPPVKKIVYTYKNLLTKQSKLIEASDLVNHPYTWLEKMLPAGATDSVSVWEIQKELTQEELITKGCDSKISEMDASKQQVFASHGFALLWVAYAVDPQDQGPWTKVKEISKAAEKDGLPIHMMYHHVEDLNHDGTDSSELILFQNKYGVQFPLIQSDEKLVKTIIRSSPGLVLLYNGTVVKNWHHRRLPSWEAIKKDFIRPLKKERELDLLITAHNPSGLIHNFTASTQVSTSEKQSRTIQFTIMDGNDVLLKKLLSDSSATGAIQNVFKMSLAENKQLISSNPKVQLVPNGLLLDGKAYQILEIK
jgi:hypothetical protein